jgi:hypothetical protein
MATKNDITGDSLISKVSNDKYRDGFAAIFNKHKCERCSKTLFEDSIHTCTPKNNGEGSA